MVVRLAPRHFVQTLGRAPGRGYQQHRFYLRVESAGNQIGDTGLARPRAACQHKKILLQRQHYSLGLLLGKRNIGLLFLLRNPCGDLLSVHGPVRVLL